MTKTIERTILEEVRLPGHWTLRPGTEFSIVGEGRFRFRRFVETARGSWIDCYDRDGKARAFDPDRVSTVHKSRKMRSES